MNNKDTIILTSKLDERITLADLNTELSKSNFGKYGKILNKTSFIILTKDVGGVLVSKDDSNGFIINENPLTNSNLPTIDTSELNEIKYDIDKLYYYGTTDIEITPLSDFEIDEYWNVNKYIGTNPIVVVPPFINGDVPNVDETFIDNTIIEEVYLPKNINVLPYFSGCTSLKKVKFSEAITYINGGTFENCTSLSRDSIDLSNITSIRNNAFSHSGINSITLPEKLVMIGNYAFEGCERLNEVKFTRSYNQYVQIGSGAFAGCTSLRRVDLPGNVRLIYDNAFDNINDNAYFVVDKNSVAETFAIKHNFDCDWVINYYNGINPDAGYLNKFQIKDSIEMNSFGGYNGTNIEKINAIVPEGEEHTQSHANTVNSFAIGDGNNSGRLGFEMAVDEIVEDNMTDEEANVALFGSDYKSGIYKIKLKPDMDLMECNYNRTNEALGKIQNNANFPIKFSYSTTGSAIVANALILQSSDDIYYNYKDTCIAAVTFTLDTTNLADNEILNYENIKGFKNDRTSRYAYSIWCDAFPDCGTKDVSMRAFSAGRDNNSLGDSSFAIGRNAEADGDYSGALNKGKSYGEGGLAVNESVSKDRYSFSANHAEAKKRDSFAANRAVTEGEESFAANRAVTEGEESFAANRAVTKAPYSSALGLSTAGQYWQSTRGKYNVIYTDLPGSGKPEYLDIVGNGEDEEHRSNAYTLDTVGNAEFSGTVKAKDFKIDNKPVFTEERLKSANYMVGAKPASYYNSQPKMRSFNTNGLYENDLRNMFDNMRNTSLTLSDDDIATIEFENISQFDHIITDPAYYGIVVDFYVECNNKNYKFTIKLNYKSDIDDNSNYWLINKFSDNITSVRYVPKSNGWDNINSGTICDKTTFLNEYFEQYKYNYQMVYTNLGHDEKYYSNGIGTPAHKTAYPRVQIYIKAGDVVYEHGVPYIVTRPHNVDYFSMTSTSLNSTKRFTISINDDKQILVDGQSVMREFYNYQDFLYRIIDNSEKNSIHPKKYIEIYDYIGEDVNIFIPSTINGIPVTKITYPFMTMDETYHTNTKSFYDVENIYLPEYCVEIANGSISANNFNVYLNKNLKVIDGLAINGYINELPEGIETLSRCTCGHSNGDKSLVLPSSLKTVNENALCGAATEGYELSAKLKTLDLRKTSIFKPSLTCGDVNSLSIKASSYPPSKDDTDLEYTLIIYKNVILPDMDWGNISDWSNYYFLELENHSSLAETYYVVQGSHQEDYCKQKGWNYKYWVIDPGSATNSSVLYVQGDAVTNKTYDPGTVVIELPKE